VLGEKKMIKNPKSTLYKFEVHFSVFKIILWPRQIMQQQAISLLSRWILHQQQQQQPII
jgi:hypothetical protein